ncbi:L-ribulose-5-phosphate 4-epimerase AraD [Flavonifractor plautii]|uniref:L-ribulose-5-phosphate 4-epimerase AraD n=1 Tax=Flavonifractor plautii TaxID=292800 RepID=UPI00232EAF40|nr:L-ribulose-5-phosphate 4-epimerase AraD [Flavonifractor plautii]MDB7955595.1 L-ribulose-5-phosphate 4-epimerase AraD [Flavonifractor plautii]
MLYQLRKQVCTANRLLPQVGLVILTWGNVSAYDPESGLMIIKPSGVAYEQLTPENMVIVDLDGTVVEGDLKPSSDTATHLELYRNFPHIGSIVHTHSRWATIWAQLGESIPPLGTTHADDFQGSIPCTRAMRSEEVDSDYEKNTGRVIVEALSTLNAEKEFAVLVREHGPFVWERTPQKAVEKAMVLEEVAMMAWHCLMHNPELKSMSPALLNKHFNRKHGENAYYGQSGK